VPLIQNPSPVRKLQRGLRLTELPDGVLAPEIVGVILLEDYSDPLSDISRGCYAATRQVAVAAEFSLITLQLAGTPAPYDLVVSAVHFVTNGVALVSIMAPTVALAGLTTLGGQFADRTIPGQPTSTFGRDTQAAIPAGRRFFQTRVAAEDPQRIPLDTRLGDGELGADSLMFVSDTANIELVAGFEWSESEPQG